ncbi:helix-turn-helix transcriptional regulator [Gordonia sp. OPL2]|uniref:helix-turn-helix transcriptional regulator n=1 Tax=Gordonia sp. OPL2 TaxID=2486274 RepID=UPI0016555D49|nr:AAA family ATPase [Gordonia sp. OPL2]ROZ89284.1 helix-turn-helix transcriptional regulator [Gordonia sp. OPL2]
MALLERDAELSRLAAHADRARAGQGGIALITGEAGAGKTAFVDEFTRAHAPGMRVLWGMCDPLSTPRPLGALFDIVDDLAPETRRILRGADHAYDIFDAVTRDLASTPTILVIDDIHWADQGTTDFLRHTVRRIHRTSTVVVITARDEWTGDGAPVQVLKGDIARSSSATTIPLGPLSVDAVAELLGPRQHDARQHDAEALHRRTAGNPFFVTELLDHDGTDLPATVRDAILARTVGLDTDCWEVLNLLTCSPGAIPDPVMEALGVGAHSLRLLDGFHLIRRTTRGVDFWHDLYRQALTSVVPPGAETRFHQRLIAAHDTVGDPDEATITHHARHAGDSARLRSAAIAAGRTAARSGAHRQSAEFFRTALGSGVGDRADDAEILELLAAELYLTDQLGEAIVACRHALGLREAGGDIDGVSTDNIALAVYEWYNGNRSGSDDHVAQSITVFEPGHPPTPALGHALAMRAFFAVHAGTVADAREHLARARQVAAVTDDPSLEDRIAIVDAICGIVCGDPDARAGLMNVLARAPRHLNELYSSGYSNLAHFDVEQRRLRRAAELLATSIDMTIASDLPVCRVWQLGSRARLGLLQGRWDDALQDSAAVLDVASAPLAHTWPLLVRGLTALRRRAERSPELEEAWELGRRYGEPLRMLPVATALVEQVWLTGVPDDRVSRFTEMLQTHGDGLEWSRGDLAVWLRRVGIDCDADGVAPPFAAHLDGDVSAAARGLAECGSEFDAALVLTETGDREQILAGLAGLDRLGAYATADRVRRALRAEGAMTIPSRKRSSTLSNRAGLTRRQVEVLSLMAEGMTNAELAERLYLSEKTVGHHVSAILACLGAPNRRDAVRRGRESGVID